MKLSKSFHQLNQMIFYLPKYPPPLQFGMTPFSSVQSWWLQSMNCDLSVTIISANLLTTSISLLGCNSPDASYSLLMRLVPHSYYVISNKTVCILSNTSATSHLSSLNKSGCTSTVSTGTNKKFNISAILYFPELLPLHMAIHPAGPPVVSPTSNFSFTESTLCYLFLFLQLCAMLPAFQSFGVHFHLL